MITNTGHVYRILGKRRLNPSTGSGWTVSCWFRSWWACRTMNGINLFSASLG